MGGILTKLYNFIYREDVIIYSGELQKKIDVNSNNIYNISNTYKNPYNNDNKEIIWII